ncbi:hypothetical protein GUJ93_ZPchr0001g30795 [Zizania palustris]|uniref:Uncharacterized protein n=1 Tax=Zizania palustris TaxID=103762 RepID=A0A8J5SD85_ZIZPA|nr:hypothetical protein GUJ93_ZPchr0001g30795 [Zizania palustris]
MFFRKRRIEVSPYRVSVSTYLGYIANHHSTKTERVMPTFENMNRKDTISMSPTHFQHPEHRSSTNMNVKPQFYATSGLASCLGLEHLHMLAWSKVMSLAATSFSRTGAKFNSSHLQISNYTRQNYSYAAITPKHTQ